MESLSTYIKQTLECDGAATPGTVMGMGNPMTPEGDAAGSGDTFDHQKKGRKKKVKPGKESQDWPSDMGQGKTNEGLLDDDFGSNDDDFGLGIDKQFEEYKKYMDMQYSSMPESQWKKFFDSFKVVCRECHDRTIPESMSIMKACRSKDYTIVAFYTKGSNGYRRGDYTYCIEIRRFIKNPLPTAVSLGYDGRGVSVHSGYQVNHPQMLNFKLSEWFVLPRDKWDILEVR